MPFTAQHRRSTDSTSLPRRVVGAIGSVLRLTNRSIQSLLGRRIDVAQRSVDPQSLALLREHILGNNKQAIMEVFGLPPKVQLPDGTIAQADEPMLADTWYFPLDPTRGTILVIAFQDGMASEAQFVDSPQGS